VPETVYLFREAAADLAAAGLLARLLVSGGDGWREIPLDAPAELPAGTGFAGADLDSRTLGPGRLFVALRGEHTDGRRFAAQALDAGAAGILAEPFTPPDTAAGDRPAVVLGATDPTAALAVLARRWRERHPVPLIGVTGSNGKTTTKDLCAALLAASGPVLATAGNRNNHLGVPLTLLDLRPEHRAAVVEMGASAPGEIAALADLAAPRVGVITNAAPAHVAGFGSLAGVVAAKGELLDALPPDGTAVLNADSPGFAAWRARARSRVVTWGTATGDHRWRWSPGPDGTGGRLELDGETWPVPLPGRHNGANLVAAVLAVTALLGRRPDPAALAGFAPSKHRSRVLRCGGVTVLDDCYNANPASLVAAAAALTALPGERALAVVGVLAELGPESDRLQRETGRRLRESGVDLVIAVGEAVPVAEGFREAGGESRVVPDAAAAAAWLLPRLQPGDRVLVKGSRAAALESVVAALERLGAPADGEERS